MVKAHTFSHARRHAGLALAQGKERHAQVTHRGLRAYLRRLQRHPEREDSTLLLCRAHFKRTAMRQGYLAGDIEPQA
ncbi:Unknown protein sequence [Pseudomonas amygdali pv. photiniae]|uniref:Uncharacterized protein n=1 Tax=Pseudomonas amygdali pv. photiniae TaxID=251724 RepID=A0A0P9V8S3_PSEA0|nr:Unknown protein sequence [Pseudomonas amygdali pv. photiniae]